jgi:hypothetical protein
VSEENKICGQVNCSKDATNKIFWPNEKPILCCDEHTEKAEAISKAMGFYLVIESLEHENLNSREVEKI